MIIPARVGRNGERGRIVRIRGLAALHKGQAEVENLHHVAGRHQNIGRLQIAMDDAFVVRGFQRFGNLPGVVESGRKRERPFDRLTRNQLHHQRANAVGVFHAINLRDVGMIQRRQNFGFALEAG